MFFILYINLSINSDFNLNQGTKLNNDGIIYKLATFYQPSNLQAFNESLSQLKNGDIAVKTMK